MKQIRSILESLKDLDKNSADSLYKKMIHSNQFVYKPRLDKETMFIFPDGRMIGGETDSNEYATSIKWKPSRAAYHNDLYEFLDDDRIQKNMSKVWNSSFEHIGLNRDFARYYNLIIVAPGHTLGFIVIPEDVEPTVEQQAILVAAVKSGGWRIEDENKEAGN